MIRSRPVGRAGCTGDCARRSSVEVPRIVTGRVCSATVGSAELVSIRKRRDPVGVPALLLHPTAGGISPLWCCRRRRAGHQRRGWRRAQPGPCRRARRGHLEAGRRQPVAGGRRRAAGRARLADDVTEAAADVVRAVDPLLDAGVVDPLPRVLGKRLVPSKSLNMLLTQLPVDGLSALLGAPSSFPGIAVKVSKPLAAVKPAKIAATEGAGNSVGERVVLLWGVGRTALGHERARVGDLGRVGRQPLLLVHHGDLADLHGPGEVQECPLDAVEPAVEAVGDRRDDGLGAEASRSAAAAAVVEPGTR